MKDSGRFVTGGAKFVDDLHLEDMLYLRFVRSPHARARITAVSGGVNASELKVNLAAAGEGAWGQAPPIAPFPVLASDYVSYVGQPVAAVFDRDPYCAEDLLDQVQVEYDTLKPLVNPEEAFRFEPIHPSMKSNVANKVQLGKDFELDAPLVLEDTLANDRISPNPMETRGLVARYDGSRLTVWASTQSVHSWKGGLCSALGLSKNDVRVLQVATGGAFGCKSALYPEYVVAAYVSMKTRKPVKWTESRLEHLQAANQGRGCRSKVKLYAERTGRVLGLKADMLIDSGAFALGIGVMAPWIVGSQLTGPYSIGKAFVTGTSVYTNKVPYGPYRGAGRPEAGFIYERMMDMLADELKLDPVDVRLRNASSEPFTSPLGLRIDPFEPFLRKAIAGLGYPGEAEVDRGVGFSSFVLVSAVQPGESCRVAVKEGVVKVWVGGNEGGQDFEVMVKTILSEQLQVPGETVQLEPGDTDQLDQGIGTWGSRSAIVISDALIEAALRIREQAESRLGALSPGEILKHEFDVTVFHRESEPSNSFGANLVVSSLDLETGEVRVEECAAYYDAGRVLNPSMVENQVVGGSAQGVGQVLLETVMYDENGQPLIASLADEGAIAATRMPRVTLKLMDQTVSSQRVKGVGESPTVGIPPALTRSVEKILGRRLRTTPLNPEDLCRKPGLNSLKGERETDH